jgi:hypothetical protein
LAPRTLHFLQDELLWECVDDVACECGESSLERSKKFIHNKSRAEASAKMVWHAWVSEYSALDITFRSDRLPAISGLANRLDRAVQGALGDYLAGLWRNTLVGDLLWTLDWKVEREKRPYKKNAPTWSWVSVDSEVYFRETDESDISSECTIIDAQCVKVGPDRFGQISSGCLTLSSTIIEVTLFFRATDSTYIMSSLNEDAGISPFLDISFDLTRDWSQINDGLRQYVDPMYCFVIASNRNHRYALLLKLVDAQEHTYERLGLVIVKLPDWSDLYGPLSEDLHNRTIVNII